MDVLFSKQAREDFGHLSKQSKQHILKKLRILSESNLAVPPTTKLQKPLRGFRLRVGVYRVLFVLKEQIIYVEKIKHRREVYRSH